ASRSARSATTITRISRRSRSTSPRRPRRRSRCTRNTRATASRARTCPGCRSGTCAGSARKATRAWSRSSCRNSRSARMEISKKKISAEDVKRKALELGADLVGIADGKAVDASHITELDAGRVIVLAKRLNDRHKYYNDELTLTHLEETSLELVYWLEDCGYPAVIVPPTHVDPANYENPKKHLAPLLSLPHAAVEAGLGT